MLEREGVRVSGVVLRILWEFSYFSQFVAFAGVSYYGSEDFLTLRLLLELCNGKGWLFKTCCYGLMDFTGFHLFTLSSIIHMGTLMYLNCFVCTKDSQKTSSAIMDRLCKFIYTRDTTNRIRTQAILSHIYHHALHDRYFEARDLMLMSHLQDNIQYSDIPTQVRHLQGRYSSHE